MEVRGIATGLLQPGDDLAAKLAASEAIRPGDILVVSAKAAATCEGNLIKLSTLQVTPEARRHSELTKKSPAFCQAVLNETERMHGKVIGDAPAALLTELTPDGMEQGSLLAINAGVDSSNVPEGCVVGWPKDPVETARSLSKALGIPVIISDSCCMPRRWGVVAIALTCCGVDPIESFIGTQDLFNTPLSVTREARADQLAVAANAAMGNAAQATPAAVIRKHGIPSSDFCGWVPGIAAQEDIFRALF